MNELSCNVIRDLIPLYKEDVCSEESRELIEAHLRTCADCRELCEELPLPSAVPPDAPDEAETFRKVSRKLRTTRLTRVMAAVSCVLLAGFAVWNAVWYFGSYRPYQAICAGMQYDGKPDGHRYAEYSDQDERYLYTVHMPNYLTGDAFVTVQPKGSTEVREKVMLYLWQEPQKTVYGAEFLQGSTSWQVHIDRDLHLIPYSGQTAEETAKYEQLAAEYHDELADLMAAAQNRWGEHLY